MQRSYRVKDYTLYQAELSAATPGEAMKTGMSRSRPRSVVLRRRNVLLGLLGWAIAACRSAGSISERPPTLKLESAAFPPNQPMPAKYTCDGLNVSPPLAWDMPPAGTQSWVLICDDPDAPDETWVHWVLYNLPPMVGRLPEGIPAQATLSLGGMQGKNDFQQLGYGGPCPPNGMHRYVFKLYALDTLLKLSPGATKAQVERAMQGHILARGELMGRYARSR